MIESKENIVNYSDIWRDFLSSIELFIDKRSSSNSLNEIISEGLKVYLKIPHSTFSSLYLLNEIDYDFLHKMTVPQVDKSELDEKFNILLSEGLIGAALDQGTIVNNFENSQSNKALLIPLLVSRGVLGFIIVSFDDERKEFSQFFSKLLSFSGNLFAGTIDNFFIHEEFESAKELLEQKVAARTLDLAQSQRELNAILDTVQTSILVVDNETNQIVKSNPNALQLINTEEKNVVGKDISTFLHSYVNNSKDNQIIKNFESALKQFDGKLIPILRSVSYLRFGTLNYRIESFSDISERKKYEDALKESNTLLELKVKERTLDLQLLVHKLKDEISEREKAEKEVRRMLEKEKELNELKSRFVTMVSHEFRTPLTVIKSAAQLIEKFNDRLTEEERIKYILRITKTVDLMTDLTENVIFMGQNGAKGLILNTIKINDFCNELIENIKLSFSHDRKINYLSKLEDSYEINVDIKLLRLILSNLLTNSAKYSKDDTEIDLIADYSDSYIKFTVLDRGIGIPESELEKIFDIFYRADNVGTISGTGLGMAVVLESVKMLKGTLDINSKVGEGTQIDIYVPKNLV